MKRNYMKICLSTLLISALLSCSEDFLTIPPQSSLTSETFFKTESDFSQAITGVYSPLRIIYGGESIGGPGYGSWLMGEMRSDNTCFILNTQNRGQHDAEEIDEFIDDVQNPRNQSKYQNSYILIDRANEVLSRIDAATFDQLKKDQIKGQALFLRALTYFDLVQYYGGVPMHLVPTTTRESAFLPRSTKDEVYALIIADATEAASLLPLKGAAGYDLGRATKGSAEALLGNVYMVLKNWAEAEAAFKEIISMGYTLLPNYADVFKTTNKNNAESIFEVQYMEGATQGQHSIFIYNFLPILDNPGVVTGVNGPQNSVGGWNTPTPDLIAEYEPGDTRLDASIAYVNGYPYVKKYSDPHSTYMNTGDNYPLYRYSEVLLSLAEALNEQGKSTEALPYLNQVRGRAGVSVITTTDQSQLRTVIMHERRVELAFESKRWPDLLRTGTAISVMNAHGAKVFANPSAYYFPAGYAPPPQSYNVTESKLLYPFPFREIQLNSKLEQNDGY